MALKKKPALRFKGFTDDWEQRKLGDLGKARSGIGFPNDEQGGKDGIPFYKVSDMNNAGNEHEMITANNYVTREQIARKGWSVIEEVPAIFFAKVGAAVLLNRKRLCRFPFLLDNNTMAYSIDRSVLNTDFAKTLFETIDLTALIQVGALPSYNAGDVENVNVVIPRMAEQKKIGANFKKLDNLITLHQRKYAMLKKIKKSFLEKMFPKNGKRVPELRFSGFTDDWEQCKVVEVAPLQRGFDLPASQMKDGPYPVIMSNGVGGWHSQYKAKGPGVVTGRSGTIGKLHYIEDNYWPHNTTLWVTNFHGNNEKFIYYLYQKLDLTRFQSGSGVPTLNRNDVHDSIVSIPLLKEQRQIADCLSGLDNLITLHQRKLEKLQNLKKALLKKMFI
ncbi:restriction endonuclease subunit S [Acidaminococcus timonensis]|jgi:type I restriction enzyme, S subunit|uniref:restriction endonuclease subunit S n=1 Tax=Acidaminococcus timonensis TaxID=1871002 RepID=UPI003A5C58DF